MCRKGRPWNGRAPQEGAPPPGPPRRRLATFPPRQRPQRRRRSSRQHSSAASASSSAAPMPCGARARGSLLGFSDEFQGSGFVGLRAVRRFQGFFSCRARVLHQRARRVVHQRPSAPSPTKVKGTARARGEGGGICCEAMLSMLTVSSTAVSATE